MADKKAKEITEFDAPDVFEQVLTLSDEQFSKLMDLFAEDFKKKKKATVARAFCGTGKDGGIDNSCSPANKGESMAEVTGTGELSDNIGASLKLPAGGDPQKFLPFIDPKDAHNAKLNAAARASNAIVQKIVDDIASGEVEVEIEQDWDTLDEDEQMQAMDYYMQDKVDSVMTEIYDEAKKDHVQSYIDDAESSVDDAWAYEAQDQATEIVKDYFESKGYEGDELETQLSLWDPIVEDAAMTFGDQDFTKTNLSADAVEKIRADLLIKFENAKQDFSDNLIESAKELAEAEWDEDKQQDTASQYAYDQVAEEWANLHYSDKLIVAEDAGVISKNTVEVPDVWKVEKNGEDYRKTRSMVRHIQTQMMQKTLEARGIDSSAGQIQEVIDDSWREWKRSSTSATGLLMQDCTAEELGGRAQNWTPEQRVDMNKAAMSFAAYAGQKWSSNMSDEEKIKLGREMMKAHIRGTWSATQYALEQAGKDHVYVYRAIMLPKDVTKDVKTKQVAVKDKSLMQLPDIALKRNGLASTAANEEGRRVANTWRGIGIPPGKLADYDRVVLRIKAPRSAVVSVPAFGQNIHAEQEVVVAGTKYKWDAWLNEAPSFNDRAMEETD